MFKNLIRHIRETFPEDKQHHLDELRQFLVGYFGRNDPEEDNTEVNDLAELLIHHLNAKGVIEVQRDFSSYTDMFNMFMINKEKR